MAIKMSFTHRHGKVTMKSGEFYKFNYQGFKHDPSPHVLFINKLEGIHPTSGNQWRFIQCINLSYIPRQDRRKFVDDWIKIHSKSKDSKITWQMIKTKYPYIAFGIRRYFWTPPYYIGKLEHLDTIDKIEKTIVGNWAKDFSKKLRMKLAQFFKRF